MNMQYSILKEIGDEVEFNANELLKKEFDEVDWISAKNPTSPYDFICKKGNEEIKIDVKSCLRKKVYIPKKKLENIIKGKFGNLYYLLRVEELTFRLIHWRELMDSEEIEVIERKIQFNKRPPNSKQITLFLNDGLESKVNKLKGLWHKNKHDTVLQIIDEHKGE